MNELKQIDLKMKHMKEYIFWSRQEGGLFSEQKYLSCSRMPWVTAVMKVASQEDIA